MSLPDEQQLNRIVQTHRILWYAFLAAPILYIVVSCFVTQSRPEGSIPFPRLGTVRVVVLVLAVACFLSAPRVRGLLLSRALARSASTISGVQTALGVGWAMVEAIALLGIVLVFLGSPLREAIVFTLAAFLGILRLPPLRHEQLREAIKARS